MNGHYPQGSWETVDLKSTESSWQKCWVAKAVELTFPGELIENVILLDLATLSEISTSYIYLYLSHDL